MVVANTVSAGGLTPLTLTIVWVTVLALLLAGAVLTAWLLRSSINIRNSAERLLSERFARGEISEEEYLQRLRTLRQAGRRAT